MIHHINKHDGVFAIDDFFSPETIAAIHHGNYKVEQYTDEREAGITARQKWEIDCSPVYAELMDFIRSRAVRDYVREYEDLSWRLVYNDEIKSCEIAISQYEPGAGFAWHVDHITSDRRRVLNWIMTLEGEAFIEWCKDALDPSTVFHPEGKTTTAALLPNKVFIFPSWYPHQVVGVSGSSRVAVHGHFGI